MGRHRQPGGWGGWHRRSGSQCRVQRIHIHGHASGHQPGAGVLHLSHARAARHIERHHQVVTFAQNAANPAAAQAARAVFDEHAHAIGPGLLHRAGEIQRVNRLAGDGIGGGG